MPLNEVTGIDASTILEDSLREMLPNIYLVLSPFLKTVNALFQCQHKASKN